VVGLVSSFGEELCPCSVGELFCSEGSSGCLGVFSSFKVENELNLSVLPVKNEGCRQKNPEQSGRGIEQRREYKEDDRKKLMLSKRK